MAQSLEVNIKTTSDVPQAMDKAKSATVSFGKQVEDIQKKFSTAFKDIFLGFTAPMVLIQGAMQIISSAIAKAKQDAKEGLELISKGETIYANQEERQMATFFKAKKAREDEMALVEKGKAELARRFMTETEEGKQMRARINSGRVAGQQQLMTIEEMIAMPGVKEEALRRFLESKEGKAYKPIFEQAIKNAETSSTSAPTPTGFKGPEGFGNVVGVGANPVMEAMTLQLEEARKQTQLLEEIRNGNGGGVPTDFTKPQPLNAASRSGSI